MKKIALTLILVMGRPTLVIADEGTFGAPVGRAPVGFRAEWTTDVTRSWPVADPDGRLRSTPRTVRVHLWYPAVGSSGAAMTFGDYMDPKVAEGVPAALADAIRANDVGTPTYSFRGIFRNDAEAYERALRTPVTARAWADPAPGKFPVVVYSVGQNDFSQDAVALAEWLASNGFIVASVPHLGTSARRALLFVHDPASYETQLRDLELALGKALKLKIADEGRILAVGHSYGGIYALLLAMRSNAVRGVVGLDPAYVAQRAGYEYDLRKFPFFDADLRVPIVTLRRGPESVNRDLLGSLRHAEQLEIEYPGLMHGDFTTVAFVRRDLPATMQLEEETQVRTPQHAAAGATAVFEQVLASARQLLSGARLDEAVRSAPGVTQKVAYTPALTTPITEELYWIYKRKSLAGAKAEASAAGGEAAFSESRTLTIARELGYSGKDEESLDMFRLASFLFPDSASAQVAAGGALLDAGRKAEARPLLERALVLEPGNETARELLHKAND